MKRFLIEMLIIGILQLISRIIVSLLGLQWDIWTYVIGATCGMLYVELVDIIFD